MSNHCIYTGARLEVQPYGFVVPADLYRCGDMIIARLNPKEHYAWGEEASESATHVVCLDLSFRSDFYHEIAGILVASHEVFAVLSFARPDVEPLHPQGN